MTNAIKCQDKFHEDEYENGKIVPLRRCDMANNKYCVGCQEERDDQEEFNRQNEPDFR
jgi:hypothetical protein